MSIKLAKEFEDLKQERDRLQERLLKKNATRLQCYVDLVKADFKNYFIKNGFIVTHETLDIIATYKNLKAVLTEQNPNESYFGVLYHFDVSLEMPRKSKQSIFVNVKNPVHSSSAFSIIHNDSIETQILELQNEIDDLKEKLTNFVPKKYALYLKPEKQTKPPIYKQFEKISDIIDEVIK